MDILIGPIAEELGMVFHVSVDDSGDATYQFGIDCEEGDAVAKSFLIVSQHDDIYGAIKWLDGYVYAKEGHPIGNPCVGPRPKRPERK